MKIEGPVFTGPFIFLAILFFMEFDLSYFKRSHFLAGCDEVGRGPLAGPVVSACTYFKGSRKKFENTLMSLSELGLTDSKKLSDKKKLLIVNELGLNVELGVQDLAEFGLRVCVTETSHLIIDEINILQASLLSMKQSFLSLWTKGEKGSLLIDGNKDIELSVSTYPIVKGDSKSLLIALSSVIAKVYRDNLMKEYANSYPYYGFEKNAGYPTAHHRQGITKFGITPIHRKSFKGVREYVKEESQS